MIGSELIATIKKFAEMVICCKKRMKEIRMRRQEDDEGSGVDIIKAGRGLSVW